MDGSPAEPSDPLGRLPRGRVVTYATIALLGAAPDLWTKEAVFRWRGLPGQRDIWWVVEDYFGIETAVNIGAVFGVGAGRGHLFAAFSVVAALGILVWLFWFKAARSLWLTCALGSISGGIAGNLYDRLGLWWKRGYPEEWSSGVRDWILVQVEGVPLLDPLAELQYRRFVAGRRCRHVAVPVDFPGRGSIRRPGRSSCAKRDRVRADFRGRIKMTQGPDQWTSLHEGRLTAMVEIAEAAGRHTLQYFRSRELQVDRKSDASPVTIADREAEQLVRDLVSKRFASDTIQGEEFSEKSGTSSYR